MINESDFLAELNSFMEEESAKNLGINLTEENYRINDMAQADYFIKLSKKCDEEMAQVEEFIKAEAERLLSQLEMFKQQQLEAIQKKKNYYDRALEDYARREFDNSGKKTIKLPNGTLNIRKQQPTYEYDDEELIKWAQIHHEELVKIVVPEPKISVDKTQLKKLITIEDGAVFVDNKKVPGVTATINDDKFSIK